MSPTETPELESESEPAEAASRALRGLAIIAVSILAIVGAGFAYLHPSSPANRPVAAAVPEPAPQSNYRPEAIYFVSSRTGWVVTLSNAGAYSVLATSDGGKSWVKELGGAFAGRLTYLHFFDAKHGVFALLGVPTEIYSTNDGGRTWTSRVLTSLPTNVVSLSFVDPSHGWLLVGSDATAPTPGELRRTDDGGASWIDLGPPALGGDLPFRVQFTGLETGWLDSLNAGPYAYRSEDGGATWQRRELPAPAGGWPTAGEFLVATRATKGSGVVATVINFQAPVGRSAIGSALVQYPPLTVDTFDGGARVRYVYTDLVNLASGSSSGAAPWVSAAAQAPIHIDLASLDSGSTWNGVSLPSDAGAIGYVDAANWWWIGSGQSSRSSDGGKTWSAPRNAGLIAPLPGLLQVLDANTAWFAGMAGALPVMETTADGGLHWRMVLMPALAS